MGEENFIFNLYYFNAKNQRDKIRSGNFKILIIYMYIKQVE